LEHDATEGGGSNQPIERGDGAGDLLKWFVGKPAVHSGGGETSEEVERMVERFQHLLSRVFTLSLDDLKNDEGQTTVEYAVVLVLVVVMAIAVFVVLQGGVSQAMTAITNKLTSLFPSGV
jgi:Flp pilus assembly pilin Flp